MNSNEWNLWKLKFAVSRIILNERMWTNKWMYDWMNTKEWINECQWMDEWRNEWMKEWMSMHE